MSRVAILSLLPHADRTYIDDRELALLSGELRAAGINNELVSAVLGPDDSVDPLATELSGFAVIVYERIWSTEIITALQKALPDTTFVACRGEHEILDPPADYWCRGSLRGDLPALLRFLVADGAAPPRSFVRNAEGRFEALDADPMLRAPESPRFTPNLTPLSLDAGVAEARRTFSILGNSGCPYQADARENPLYEGISMPEGVGRGCAFCTTGNHYAHSPPAETAGRVLEQIRHVRAHAPRGLDLVIKDQNPFLFLVPLLEGMRAEGLGGFRLLLETRADWFVRNRARFERALTLAPSCDVRIAPYLVGIESFADAELERFNKGISAADNEAFLLALWDWNSTHQDALDLGAAAFGFVLFTPWTTFEDLERNHAAILRTGLWKLRGKLLTSWARLYPDTALFYLAERDGLLEDRWPGADPSARHGYHPSRPWRFLDPKVAEFASAALERTEATGGRDQVGVFGRMLDEARGVPDTDGLRARLSRWVRPLDLDALPGGFRLVHLARSKGAVTLTFDADDLAPLQIVVTPGAVDGAAVQTRHYSVGPASPPRHARATEALDAFCSAFAADDGARGASRAESAG